MTKELRDALEQSYGIKVDHDDTQVYLYDIVTGTTIGIPISMAEILLDELRFHVANARALALRLGDGS